MRLFLSVCIVATGLLAAVPTPTKAQEREDRTLLNWDQMNAIANEASGERAKQNVLEQVPYQRVRPLAEYGENGHFRESLVVERLAGEFGFSDVSIETYSRERTDWQPTVGQLYLQGPPNRKLFDIYDTPVALASRSQNGDVTAEVVNVGFGGRAEDYEGKDVTGKVVLGSAGTSQLQRLGVFERGAVGVLSYRNVYPIENPNAMLSQSISASGPDGEPGGFGWSISSRIGHELIARLNAGGTVTVRSIVEASTIPGELEVIHATIPGDGSSDEVVFISSHVFEGYIKQGANDDNSGVGLTLEMGRAYIQLIKQGVLPQPKRTIHFLWIPEFSGTYAWLDAHPEVQDAAIANLNFDMEGIQLSKSGSFWVLHRTPDTVPSFINDVAQSFMESMAETNRERIRFRSGGYFFSWPVLSQNGSRDPFYIKIDKHYGASDHVAFMNRGIPSVMFITWPDRWYHTSQDTPDKLDPTQFRRAAVIGIGTMAIIAGMGDAMAYRVANESFGRGAERISANQRKGLGYLADATNGAELTEAYKEAKNAVLHQTQIEKEVIKSTGLLFDRKAEGIQKLEPLQALLDARAQTLLNEVTASFRIAAEIHGVPATEPAVTEVERKAARLVVETSQSEGPRPTLTDADIVAMGKVPGHMRSELRQLQARGMTVMEIRNFLAGEFDPLPLNDLLAYFRVQERLGSIKLVQK